MINETTKLLVCSHCDDEIIFFNPDDYDKIVIVFGDFGDKRGSTGGDARRNALKELPYFNKIIHLNLVESNYWRDKSKKNEYWDGYNKLCDFLKTIKPLSVTTHSNDDRYGHDDHTLAYNACMDSLDCPVNGKNPILYRTVKNIYKKHGVWTWNF